MLESETIKLEGTVYKLAGITMHNCSHYCCIVNFRDSLYWYDGLKGNLKGIVDDWQDWFPSYLVY